jgi:hypothetical protein
MNFLKQAATVSWLVFFSITIFITGCRRQDRLPLGDNRPVVDDVFGGDKVAEVTDSVAADTGVPQECPIENLTRRCQCEKDGNTVFGRQTCDEMGRWGQCECAELPETIIFIEADDEIGEPQENRGNVTFSWEQTIPASGECVAGVYVGAFTCEMKWDTLPVGYVTGPVSFTLEQSPSGEFLVIEDGTLTGQTDFGIIFTSHLTGSLDCSADSFRATVLDGVYGVPPLMIGTFAGTLEAPLDRSSQTLAGTWSLYDEWNPEMPCTGPWDAVRQP